MIGGQARHQAPLGSNLGQRVGLGVFGHEKCMWIWVWAQTDGAPACLPVYVCVLARASARARVCVCVRERERERERERRVWGRTHGCVGVYDTEVSRVVKGE